MTVFRTIDLQQAAIEYNEHAWDSMSRKRKRFTTAAVDDDFVNPLSKLDGCGWLDAGIAGKKLLCLAAGGGRHAAMYAATEAHVTVVDISAAQLELDREVARERNLQLRTVQTSMDDLSMFETAEFDIVIHPVSTCYIPNLQPVFQQIARVTSVGGLYISQHKQPTNLQADAAPAARGYELVYPYYLEEPLPQVEGSLHREHGTREFIHRWEQIIGGICRSGFFIEDLIEPLHAEREARPGTFAHRSYYVAPYVRIKARRRHVSSEVHGGRSGLWLPSNEPSR